MPLSASGVLDTEFDVCVVGAGPAGLAAAFGCCDRGLRTLLIEAGGQRPRRHASDLFRAEISDPRRHAPVERTNCAALGGTSHWWGGRVVPMDPVDFAPPGNGADGAWPIGYADLMPWWQEAARFLGAEALVETRPPGAFAALRDHSAWPAESWGPEPNVARRWRERIRQAQGPAILLGARATGLAAEGARIGGVLVRIDGQERIARARHTVLACGGLGVLRLLLNASDQAPDLLAGRRWLGERYMGHLTGAVADLVPKTRDDIDAFGRKSWRGNIMVRRRIAPTAEALARHDLANISFWLDSPPIGDPSHRSGVLSAKYLMIGQAALGRRLLPDAVRGLALRGARSGIRPHLRNVASEPIAAGLGLARAAVSRLVDGYHRPGRLICAGEGGWRLFYHAEQRPDPANRVTLSDRRDEDGLRLLRIDYGFSEADRESIVRAHALLDADLQRVGAGRLRYLGGTNETPGRVAAAARDGYHQLGGTRMSHGPESGVVDPNCRAHGVENLWIASSSVFPRGGQANPTLTIVALACRLADHLGRGA